MTAPQPSKQMKYIAWKDVDREKLNPLIDRRLAGDRALHRLLGGADAIGEQLPSPEAQAQ